MSDGDDDDDDDDDDVSDGDEMSREDDLSDGDDPLGEDKNIVSIRNNDTSFHYYHAGISSEKTTEQLANALRGNTHLKGLSLFCWSNLHDKKYTDDLASAIVNAKITHLSLAWHSVYDDEDYYVRSLLDAARRSPTIQHLDVFTMEKQGNHEIASCMQHLQSLELTGVGLVGDVALLCEGLHSTSTLTSLHLTHTSIGSADDIRQLSQALANNSSITSLQLDACNMDNDSVKAFLEYWHHDSQIHTLAFPENEIKTEGAMLLIQAASNHPAMENLSIAGNLFLGYDGLASIAMELPNVVLKSLNIARCVNHGRRDLNLGEEALVVGDLIMQGVSANTHLLNIRVSGNRFNDADQGVVKALTYYTLRNKYIPLMVSDFCLPTSFWCHCFAKNSRYASFIFYFLREQPLLWQECRKNRSRHTH